MSLSLFHIHGISNYPSHFINDKLILIESGSILSCLNIENGQQHFVLALTEFDSILCIASNPSNKIFAIALQSDKGARIELYSFDDIDNIKLLHTFEECSSVGYSHIDISHNGEYMIAISNIPHLQIEFWSILHKHKLASTNIQFDDPKYVSFSPTSHEVFMTANNHTIILWRVYFKFDQYFLTSTIHSLKQTRQITSIIFGEAGNEIIYCNNFGEMVIFDENTASDDYNHNIKHRFDKPEAIISILLFTRFYYIIIGSDNDGIIQFISKNNFQNIYQYNIGSSIKHCIFTPNYKQLIIVNKENKLINCTINKTLLTNNNEQFISDTNLIQQNEIFKFIQIKANPAFNIISLQTNDCILLHTQQNLKLIQLSDTNTNANSNNALKTFDFPICNVSTMEIYHYNHGVDLIALGFNDGHFGLCYVNNAINIKLFFAQHLFKNSMKQIEFDISGTLIACICNQESKIWFIEIIPDAEPQIIGYYELNNIPICCCWISDEYDNLKIIISFDNGFVSTYDAPDYNENSDELLLESYYVDCEVDFSLQKIIRDPNETSPDRLLCLTEDNKLKAFLLDDDATVFPDDTFIFNDHYKRISDIRIQNDLLLTSSMDGCILIRYLSDPDHILASIYAHNASYIAKGILCTQFVHSGSKIISVGFDGSVISWQLNEDIQFENEDIQYDCPLNIKYLNQINEIKINKNNKIIYPEKIENDRINNKKKEFEPTLYEIKDELEQLRINYSDIVDKVNNASELEKLEENELIVDNKQYDSLFKENKKEINKICQEIKYENIGKQLIMRRIKEECYDGMKEKLQIVGGIKCNEKVTTFPILSQNQNDLLLNKKLQFLRKMNIIEQEWSTKTQDRVRMEFDIKRPMNNKSIKYIWDINELKEKENKDISNTSDQKEKDDKTTKKDKKNGNDNDDRVQFPVTQQLKNLLYHPMKLYTNYSKRIQINLLNLRIRELKSCFNKEIEIIFKLKTAEIERINEMALEISDIEQELGINISNVNVYKLDDDEDKEGIFKVNENEINVEKVLTEKELNKLKELEVERLKRLKNANNDLTERALLEMMNNRLDSKDDVERLKDTLKKPDFMDKIDESEWSEQEKTKVLQYQEKKEALIKAKEIRIKLLQTRLKSLKNDLNEICKNFDSKLKLLYNIRLCVMQDIYVHELMLIHLINDIIEYEQYNKKIKNMNLELNRLKQDQKKADITYNQFNTKLQEYKNKLIDLFHNDKYLEKQFKKEFNPNTMNGVADYFDYLFKLFRGKKAVRPKRNNANKSIPNLERKTSSFSTNTNNTNDSNSDRLSIYRSKNMYNKISSELLSINDIEIEEEKEDLEELTEKEELNPYFIEKDGVNDGMDLSYLIKPMDLGCNIWNKFLEYRKLKINKDKEINDLNEQICSMEAEVNALNENKHIILESIEEINKSTTEIINKKNKYKLDCELFFCLKQGNVEILELPVVTDMRQSILLNRNVIEDLNKIILNAGSQQIEQLNEIKKFRRGINLLNWRNKILDLEYRYYTLLTTEYQLRRVTKKDQEILTIGGFNDNNSKKKEIKSLEKKLLFTKNTINTKIKEKKKENNKYINRITQINKSNDDLLKEIKKLKNDVLSKQEIVNIRGAKSIKNEKKESNKKKMDAIVTRRKLVDLVKAQSDEIQFLRNELDRLRRKTFPSFSIADSQ